MHITKWFLNIEPTSRYSPCYEPNSQPLNYSRNYFNSAQLLTLILYSQKSTTFPCPWPAKFWALKSSKMWRWTQHHETLSKNTVTRISKFASLHPVLLKINLNITLAMPVLQVVLPFSSHIPHLYYTRCMP
jgi:hypothetical protein